MNIFKRIFTRLFPKKEIHNATNAKPVEITKVTYYKEINAYDIEYKTDAKPGELVTVDLSEEITIP